MPVFSFFQEDHLDNSGPVTTEAESTDAGEVEPEATTGVAGQDCAEQGNDDNFGESEPPRDGEAGAGVDPSEDGKLSCQPQPLPHEL